MNEFPHDAVCSSLQKATAEHFYSNPTNWWGLTAPVAKIKLSDGDSNLNSPGYSFSESVT